MDNRIFGFSASPVRLPFVVLDSDEIFWEQHQIFFSEHLLPPLSSSSHLR
jgi:hypothetical protein